MTLLAPDLNPDRSRTISEACLNGETFDKAAMP
jgi:hypothetical protein